MGCSQGKASSWQNMPDTASAWKSFAKSAKDTSQDTGHSPLLLGSQDAQKVSGPCQSGHTMEVRMASSATGLVCDECQNYITNQEVYVCCKCNNFSICERCSALPDALKPPTQTPTTITPSPRDESKPQEISADEAAAGPQTEMQTTPCSTTSAKALTVGTRVTANVDIKYNEDLCVPKGTLGTVAFVLHRSLWVNWDGIAALDDAVVLASQVKRIDELELCGPLPASAQQVSELKGASSVIIDARMKDQDLGVEHSSHAAMQDHPLHNVQLKGASSVIIDASMMKQDLGAERSSHAAMQGHPLHNIQVAEQVGLKMGEANTSQTKEEKREVKSDGKPARKEKTNMCCC